VHVWFPTCDLKDDVGPLDGVSIEVVDDWRPDRLPPSRQVVEIVIPPQTYAGDFAAVAACLPRLRVVQTLSAGVEQYSGALPSSVQLYNAAGVHVAATSEWAVAAILASQRDLLGFDEQRRTGIWRPRATRGLAGTRAVILGAGEIGRAVGVRLQVFGAEVTFVGRRTRGDVVGVDRVHDLLPHADIVVLLIPLTAATSRLADRDFLSAMKDGALLVNASRGAVVDTAALLDELTTGRLRAALDVFDPEPPQADSQVWATPGLLLTPHIASSTVGVHERQVALLTERLPAFGRHETIQGLRDQGY
jgi:phosphoglycerate dehydrogenase-like enzyme